MTTQNPAAPVQKYDEDYILTDNGVYFIPEDYIKRDRLEAIYVSRETWTKSLNVHGKLNAEVLLSGVQMHPDLIVCVQGRLTTHEYATLWCVRFSLHAEQDRLPAGLAENFLWPLPYRLARGLYDNYSCHTVLNNDNFTGAGIVTQWKPTHHDFNPLEWPEVSRKEILNDYFDRMTVMTWQPNRLESALCVPVSMARPNELQEKKNKDEVDFDSLPVDMKLEILGDDTFGMFHSLLSSNDPRAFSTLLALRGTSKKMRDLVDGFAGTFLESLQLQIRQAHASARIDDLLIAGNACRKASLIAPYVEHEIKPTLFSLARLRTGRPRWKTMPPLTTRPVPLVGAVMAREMNKNERNEMKKCIETIDTGSVKFLNVLCKSAQKALFPVDNLETRTQWLIWTYLFGNLTKESLLSAAAHWRPMVQTTDKRPREAPPLTVCAPKRTRSAEV